MLIVRPAADCRAASLDKKTRTSSMHPHIHTYVIFDLHSSATCTSKSLATSGGDGDHNIGGKRGDSKIRDIAAVGYSIGGRSSQKWKPHFCPAGGCPGLNLSQVSKLIKFK